jgi:hypothetical protein
VNRCLKVVEVGGLAVAVVWALVVATETAAGMYYRRAVNRH